MIHLLAYQSTFRNTRTCCSPSQNFLHFTLQRCDFPDFWAIPFDTKVIFFTKEEMNSNICRDTLVGIPEYLRKHQDVLLSIAELPTFFIANVRFSRFLSHPFWYKSHFFHKRRDDFEHLSRYTCWHTREPSQTPGRLALHRRTSYIFHCKGAIFPIFEPSLLIQKSFFSQKKRWIRTSVTVHLLAYQSNLHKHRDVLLPIAELPTFYIAKVRFSRFLSHPFWYKSHFFHKRKDEFENLSRYTCWHTRVPSQTPGRVAPHRRTSYILHCKDAIFPILSHPFWYKSHFFHKRRDEFEHLSRYTCWHTRVPPQTPGRVALHRRTSYIFHCKCAIFPIFEPSLLIQKSFFSQKKRWLRTSVTIHLLAYQRTFTNTRTSCSPSQNFLHFSLQRCDFPDFWAIPFDTKVIFFTKEKMNSNICHDTLVGIPEYLHKHQDVLLSIAELPTFYIANVRFSRFLSHPFWYKIHFFHQRKDESEHLSRYTCWHTRVPSKTPGSLALHRRTSYILHCKYAIFPIFEPSLLIQKSFFSQKKRWIRTSVAIHLLAYQSTFTNTGTCCSPSQNFLHFTLQRCDFPDFWAIPFDTKVIFFTKEEMASNICHDTLVGIPENIHKHQDVLLSIAELPTFFIAKVRFSRFLSHPFWYKSHFFHKRKDEFEHLSRYTCWHTRVPSQTPGRVALHRRTSYILHCKCAIFAIFEPSLLIQNSFFSPKKRWIGTSVTIHLLAYQSTFKNTRKSCSPSQNFLHFTLQICDFPDFWAIPFDTKVIFFTKEEMNSNICRDTLVGIPEYLHKHQDVLLSIAELPTFFIANVRFSRFLSHPFWYKSHFFHKEEMTSNICHDTLVGIPENLHKHPDVLLSIAELPTFFIAKVRFSRFLSHPFWYKSHFFHKRKDEFEHLSRYTCWHTRVPSQTPGRVAPHRRTSYILHCKDAIFPILSHPFDTKVIFFTKEEMNSNICHDTLVGIPEYLHKHQDVLLSIAELPTFFIANVRFSRFLSHPFWYKSHFFSQKNICHDTLVGIPEMTSCSSNICHDTLVGIPEYLHKHQDVLLSIAELPTFYIANVRFSRFLSHPFWYKIHFFHQRKDESEHLSRYTCWHTRVPSKTPGSLALHRRTSYILHCKYAIFPIFEPSLLIQKSFFHKRKDEFEHLSRYTCWHTRVPSQTPGRVAPHRRTSYILHCKGAIFPIFEPSLLIQK